MQLKTARTILTKYETNDFEAFCEVICNDEVMLHIFGKGHTVEVARQKFDSLLKINTENSRYGMYKVNLLNTNKLIGFAKITPFETDYMELGYALLPEYWRQGFTIEMIQKMVAHCQEQIPEKKIMAIVNLDNVASVRVLEKLYFKKYKEQVFKEVICHLLEFHSPIY